MSSTRGRGRPATAGERRRHRIEVRVTTAERDSLQRLARPNGISLAEVFRLGACHLAAYLEEGGRPPIVLGGAVVIASAPDASPVELLPGLNRR